MKKALVFFTGLGVGILLTCHYALTTSIVNAQTLSHSLKQPAKSSRKILIDNDRVQVIDYTLLPGDQTPGRHTHRYPHVDVILAGGSVVVNNADGSVGHLTAYTDSVYYRSAHVTHEPINTGDTPIHMIEVHVK